MAVKAETVVAGTYLRKGDRMVEVVGEVEGGNEIEVRNIVTDTVLNLPVESLDHWTVVVPSVVE